MAEALPHIESPWALEDMMDGGMVRADDPNRPGKRFLVCTLGPHHRSKADQDLAAGHGLLIKAAPAMLKALQEFIRIDGFISMHEMFEKDWEPAVKAARAAIALATEWPIEP